MRFSFLIRAGFVKPQAFYVSQVRRITSSSSCVLNDSVLPEGSDAFRKREKASEDLYIKKKEIERLKHSKKNNQDKENNQDSQAISDKHV